MCGVRRPAGSGSGRGPPKERTIMYKPPRERRQANIPSFNVTRSLGAPDAPGISFSLSLSLLLPCRPPGLSGKWAPLAYLSSSWPLVVRACTFSHDRKEIPSPASPCPPPLLRSAVSHPGHARDNPTGRRSLHELNGGGTLGTYTGFHR